jgi:hypothetical protein
MQHMLLCTQPAASALSACLAPSPPAVLKRLPTCCRSSWGSSWQGKAAMARQAAAAGGAAAAAAHGLKALLHLAPNFKRQFTMTTCIFQSREL